MRTGFRNHGYYGHTFVGSRLLSGIALLAIIGLVANFTTTINKVSLTPPLQLTGAMIVSAAALLWVLLSFTAYDDTHIPYLATAIVDSVFLIPFVVVVVILGGQLSKTECSTLPAESGTQQLKPADTAGNSTLSFITFIATDQMTCYKLQGTWGLTIALCILFTLSALAAAFMFMGKRKNGYKGAFFGKNTARIGKGKPVKGQKSPETWTSQNVNNTRSAGPGSPKKNKKSKQKKQQNGQNQTSSYDKGYSFFKPSTWTSSGNSSANSASSTSRGVNNPGSSSNSSSARNMTMNNQAPDLSPSKNISEPQPGSTETPGKWTFGFGRLWRKGGRDRSKNTAPHGHQQEDIALTDVPQGRRNTPNTTATTNTRDLGAYQEQSKGKGFLGLFRSTKRARDQSSSTSPQPTNRSLDPQQQQTPFPTNGNQAVNSARPLQGDAFASESMPGNRRGPSGPNGGVNGRPGPNASRDMGPSSKGPVPMAPVTTPKNVKLPRRQGGPTPPLTQNPTMPPAAMQRGNAINGKSDPNMTNLNKLKASPNVAAGPGSRPADGATIGNLTRGGERSMGFQRPRVAPEATAGYVPPPDIRKGEASSNIGRGGKDLDRKQSGLNELNRPVPGQPLPSTKNGQRPRPGEQELITRDAPSAKRDAPDQQDGFRGLRLPGRDKKTATPTPAKGVQPHKDRTPSAAETNYLATPLNPAAEKALGRGKTGAEKKGELETKSKAGELPVKQPHRLQPQGKSFEDDSVTTTPMVAGALPNRQAKPLAGKGRPEHQAGPKGEAGLPLHDGKSRPAPAPPATRDLPNGQPPTFDERGRPAHQRTAGGPAVPASLAPGQPPRDPRARLEAQSRPLPPKRPIEPEIPGNSAPRELMRNEPKGPKIPARDESGRPALEPEVPNALATGRNQRDNRRAEPTKPDLEKREIPNALLAGGRTSHESARDANAASNRRQPSPPRDGPRRPDGSRRAQSPQPSRGRRDGGRGRQPSPSKGRSPSPPKLRGPRGTERQSGEMFLGDSRAQNTGERGRPVPPVTEAPNLSTGNERKNTRPVPSRDVEIPDKTMPLPPTLKGSAMPGTSSSSRGLHGMEDSRPIPPPSERSLGPEPSNMRSDKDRRLPPVVAAAGEPPQPPTLKNLATPRERSRPPPRLNERQSLFQPGMRAQDSNAAPMPKMPPSQGAPQDVPPQFATPDALRPGRGGEKNGARMPKQGPTDVGQSPLTLSTGFKADGGDGKAPPLPSRIDQTNDKAVPFTSSSRDMNAGKVDESRGARNAPSPAPSSATESPSKPRGLKGWFTGRSRKDKKQAEATTLSNVPNDTAVKRPSLLPPERRQSALSDAAAGGVVQPDQRGLAPFSQPNEMRPDQQDRDLPRGLKDPKPLYTGVESLPKSLRDPHIPHSRNGQDPPPAQPEPKVTRGRASVFPVRPGQKPSPPMPSTANNLTEINAGVTSEDAKMPPMPVTKEQKKSNRKSIHPGMMPPMQGQDDLPAVPQDPTVHNDSDKHPIPDDTQTPPVPELNGKQRRAANRKSHMTGFGPTSVQMPPMPGMPEQPSAHKDGLSMDGKPRRKGLSRSPSDRLESSEISDANEAPFMSNIPSSLRPGVFEGTPRGPRDLVDESAKAQPAMMPPSTGPRRGLPSRPNQRGPARELSQRTENNLAPATGIEASDFSQESQVPSSLRPGRPDLKVDTKDDEELPLASGNFPVTQPKSRDMRTEMSDMTNSPKISKRGKGREQTRQPLSPLDGNMSPRSPFGAESGKFPSSLQNPASPKSNKFKDLFGKGKGKGKDGVLRDAGSPTMSSHKSLSPTSRLAEFEREMDSISSSRPIKGNKEQVPARFSDSSFTDDMLNSPVMSNNAFTSDKDMSSKNVYGRTPKDAPGSFADEKKSHLGSGPSVSASKKKDKSREKPDFFGGIFGGKDEMSPMGSPTFNNDEPWAAAKDTNASEDNKPGLFKFSKDKKDKKQRRDSRNSMPGSPSFMNDAPRSPDLGEPWPTGGDIFDQNSGDKKTTGLFGRGKDKTKTGSKSPTEEKHGLFGFGNGKDKSNKLQSSSPGQSPTEGSALEPWSAEEDLTGEKKTGLFNSFGKGKDKKNKSNSPLASPTWRDSTSLSPGLEPYPTEDAVVSGSKDKDSGLFSSFGKDKKQRRGSNPTPLSPDRDSMFDHANGQLEETASGEKKSGLKGLFSKGKDKNKRRGSDPEPLSPGKEGSEAWSPTMMDEQQTGSNNPVVIPALLVLQGQSQPGSPMLSGEKKSDQFDTHSVDGDYDGPLSPQEGVSSLSEADKKNKKGKGLFGRFGKSKDGDVTPTSLDGFNGHDDRPLSSRLESPPLSPEMGKKDKNGKGIFGFGKKKDRDSSQTSPFNDEFNHQGMSPQSPGRDWNQRQSGDMDSFPADQPMADSPVFGDSMASPRQSFGNSSPLYSDEPEKMKPAPLDLKGKMRNFFDKFGGPEGDQDNSSRRSSRDFDAAPAAFDGGDSFGRQDSFGAPGPANSPPMGGTDDFDANMPPSPMGGTNNFEMNNSMPSSPSGGAGMGAAPMPMDSPAGMDNFGPNDAGGFESPVNDSFNQPGMDEPGMGGQSPAAPMDSFDGAPGADGFGSPQPDMGSPPRSPAMDNFDEPAPFEEDLGGATGPSGGAFSPPPPASDDFGGSSTPIDDYSEPAAPFDDFGNGAAGGFSEPEPVVDSGSFDDNQVASGPGFDDAGIADSGFANNGGFADDGFAGNGFADDAPADIGMEPMPGNDTPRNDLAEAPMGDDFGAEPPMGDNFGAEPPMDDNFGAEPPMGDDFGAEPPMGDDFDAEPSMGDDFGAEPPMGDGFGAEPPMDDNFGAEPPMGDDFGAEPPMGDDFGAEPPMGDDFGAEPMGDDFGAEPPMGDDFAAEPMGEPMGDNFGAEPMGDDFGAEPPMGDDFGAEPPMGDDFGAEPPMGDDFGEPVGEDFGDGDRGLGDFGAEAPMGDEFGEPPMGDDFGEEPPMGDDFGADPMGDDFGAEPMGDDFGEEPPMGDDFGEPPMDDGFGEEPPMDGEFGDPPMDDGFGEEPPMDGEFGEPPMDDGIGEEPPMDDEFGEPPMDDEFGEEPMGEDFGDGDRDLDAFDEGLDGDAFPEDEFNPGEEDPEFEGEFAGDDGGEEFDDGMMDDGFVDDQGEMEEEFDDGEMDGAFMDEEDGDGARDLDEDMENGDFMGDEEGQEDFGEEEFAEGDGEDIPEDMMGDEFGEDQGELDGDEFPEDGEGEEERELDEEAFEDGLDESVPGSPIGSEGGSEMEGSIEDLQDEEVEEDGLDDDELQGIMDDDEEAPGSPTGSDYERGMASPGMEESPEDLENDQEPDEEVEMDEQPEEPQSTNDVRLSQLYRNSAVFSPVLTSPLPPSPPPEQDTNKPQDEELDSTDPVRYSHLYRQSVNLDITLSPDSPGSDGGLSAIAESPNMDQGQTFDVPVMAPVPDFAKRRSERMSSRMSTMSQQLAPIAEGPLSPRPLATPPPEEDEDYDNQAGQPTYDQNYDVERAMSPEEEYENYYDEDDEYEPHGQRDSGPTGPQTFDEMDLSRPGPSPSERYSYHEDLEQGPPMTPFTPNANRKTLRERMSGW
ncbi:hypothetical protein Daus18300_003858 [Diaporthe australafricana]|uniref:MARVEL domain-containing protein n=1 Tax=Diaporthe australafricana TaxID=127596 RepID=A0ABR3XCV2_9PEZI